MWYEVAPDRILTADCIGEKYKVMVHRPDPEVFHVYVDKNFFRRFTVDTMPDKLKEHIAMIHTFNWDSLGKDFYVPPLQKTLYTPEYMMEIGWMTSPVDYCVLLDKNFIDELKGVSVSQDTLTKDEVKG